MGGGGTYQADSMVHLVRAVLTCLLVHGKYFSIHGTF
jgi:hypothetical protein